MLHWNTNVLSLLRSELSNGLGLHGLTRDFNLVGAGGVGGTGGMESAARWSVMARSMSVNWLWYW